MRESVTIVENMAIASVQSICFFEWRPIVKTAVKALRPIFRILAYRSACRLIDCAAESLTLFGGAATHSCDLMTCAGSQTRHSRGAAVRYFESLGGSGGRFTCSRCEQDLITS